MTIFLCLLDAFVEGLAKERGDEAKVLAAEALDAVMVYDWPGNVRELENALEHAITLSRGRTISLDAVPERVRNPKAAPIVTEKDHENPTLEAIERAYIMWVLQAEGGNKSRAAEVLGIDPSTLYRKLGRYDAEAS